MIVVDTSALIAVALDEADASAVIEALVNADALLMSAGTLVELMVVAAGKDVRREVSELLEMFDLTIVPVDEDRALAAGNAYPLWGRGFGKAKLNFGDCFAYALARERGCPLLFVGNDFALTDIVPAITKAELPRRG